MSQPTRVEESGTKAVPASVQPIRLDKKELGDFATATAREWIETNGIGGWASSSVTGANTRRYHGLLVAATRPPLGRIVLLSRLDETVTLGTRRVALGTNQFPGAVYPDGFTHLASFERGIFPVLEYRIEDTCLQKTVVAIDGENTTVVIYDLREGREPVTLELRPFVAGRDYHALRHADDAIPPTRVEGCTLRVGPLAEETMLHLLVPGGEFEAVGAEWWHDFEYERERERGFGHREDLWTPGVMRVRLAPGERIGVIASTTDSAGRDAAELVGGERARRESLLDRLPLRDHVTVPLALAADQFLVRRGVDLRTVIAGYHWFGDWGRDTLIALPGLTLATGRPDEARRILQTFAAWVDRGMIPNRFPDEGDTPEYNTADATLWFFVALRAYVRATGDNAFVAELLPALREIIRWHREGTRFGIRVDADGLLHAGEPGVQLTWMDAKVGDWVVTPRTGKPVEINALWYNALRILGEFEREEGEGESAEALERDAARVRRQFARMFWYREGGHLYDVVDGDRRDAAVRPNQIFACSLPFPLLSAVRRRSVLRVVEEELLTPVGLRSLAPSDPAYQARYEGDTLRRDCAYHQGTVWLWLLGPFVTALVRERGARGRAQARTLIERVMGHLAEAGIGSMSEIFDGDPPHEPRGAIAQAWSVAEVLRAWVEDVKGNGQWAMGNEQ